MLLRRIAFVLLAAATSVPASFPATAAAQQANANVDPSVLDKRDARAFAILFRRENSYLKIAKTASSPDDPKSRLGTVIPTQLQLDTIEAGNLLQIAAQWEAAITPVRAQLNAAIVSFHGTFPNGRLNKDIEATPPASLVALRAQIDTITLRYRDRFRNVLLETRFQSIQSKMRSDLGVTSMPAPTRSADGAQ